MTSFIAFFLLFALVISGIESDISCTFSRSTKKVKCGYQECSAVTDDTPIGYYKRSKIALHPGSRSMGCISVPDANCWSALEKLLTSERSSILSVTGVERSGYRSYISFSCNGGLGA
ncbi:unnamed protein product, partial [Rotaria sp. Silwood1]